MNCETCGSRLASQETDDRRGAFTPYEYKSIVAPKAMEAVYVDCYRAFGWEPSSEVNPILSLDAVSLSFKRDRAAKGNVELTKLQAQCDAALRNLQLIEAKKRSTGMVQALSVGVVAALVLGGGMSLCLTTEYLVAGIVVGVAGLIGCAFPYFINKSLRDKKAETFATASDEQYDKLVQICARAQLLLK